MCGGSLTFREDPLVELGAMPQIRGAAPVELEGTFRWGIAATAHQAAEPRTFKGLSITQIGKTGLSQKVSFEVPEARNVYRPRPPFVSPSPFMGDRKHIALLTELTRFVLATGFCKHCAATRL